MTSSKDIHVGAENKNTGQDEKVHAGSEREKRKGGANRNGTLKAYEAMAHPSNGIHFLVIIHIYTVRIL